MNTRASCRTPTPSDVVGLEIGKSSLSKTPTPEIKEKNIKICRLVAKQPCLFDRSNEGYNRKSFIKRVWRDISHKMHDSINSCKERWRNIRTSYARSIKDGYNQTRTYYLSAELAFLRPHITPGVPRRPQGRRSRANITGRNVDTNEQIFGMEHAQEKLEPDHEPNDETRDEDTENYGSNAKEYKYENGAVAVPWPSINSDDAFLHGIRPEMEQMNFRQKLCFKRRVYALLGEIFDSTEAAQISDHQMAARSNDNEAISTSSASLVQASRSTKKSKPKKG
ncbi:uncharacterized protein LOC117580347 [Drosophila guanche]|uniref:MADF domain-containing protein n=1 Tax=Drosophila guanche TaxID=7266 RepID=A0A3B0J814_DROGU|nr:uncharacterized protein LOC117580347 [Drosophila guanche]XP_034122751.1 uncharacterized protein LOC117580347 [Drosophila guanche]XP_034122752.1 uncharacterized protein LOC117580347 [Drosophila guanche]XP_034122753.1 uncharacterized protein LOC117580347 [Drosophila guanche]SPP76082.1 Hypothetical predicted protein [Drosophila guanche]